MKFNIPIIPLLLVCASISFAQAPAYNITPRRAIPTEARVHACFDHYSLGITDPLRWRGGV